MKSKGLKNTAYFLSTWKNISENSLFFVYYTEIYQIFKIPIIIESWAPPAAFILELFQLRRNYIEVKLTPKHWYYLIKPNEEASYLSKSNLLKPIFDCYPFDCSHLCAYTNLWVEKAFNLNHHIIQYYINHFTEINQQQKSFSLFTEFLREFERFNSDIHSSEMKNPTSEINYLNTILNKINEARGTHFKLSKNDFPDWINEKIEWEKKN